MKPFVLILVLASAAAAQRGTLATSTLQWNGRARTFLTYAPPVLQSPPALVLVLQGTAVVAAPALVPVNVYHNMAWDQLADANGFVVVEPLPTCKQTATKPTPRYACFWEALGTESYFPAPPDDSGFLAALVGQEMAAYGVDPNRVFVMGFSSGGMMAQRMGIEHADLFAALAPLSGTAWVGPAPAPPPARPINILEMHGDADPTIPYCGGVFQGWGERAVAIPSVDADMAYWAAADGVPSPAQLCDGPAPAAFGFSGTGAATVQFVREIGFVHKFTQPAIAQVWEFFATHGR